MQRLARFGDLLAEYLRASGMTHRDFAKKCGFSGGFPANMISGKRSPPAERLDAMADAFGLKGEKRTQFIKAGHEAHATDGLRQIIEEQQVLIDFYQGLLNNPLIPPGLQSKVGRELAVKFAAVQQAAQKATRELMEMRGLKRQTITRSDVGSDA